MMICKFLPPKMLEVEEKHYVCCHLCDQEVLAKRAELEANYEKEQQALAIAEAEKEATKKGFLKKESCQEIDEEESRIQRRWSYCL